MNSITFILLFFFLAFITIETKAQCISGDCYNGNGIFITANGDKWIGDFQQGKLYGAGSCYYKNGNIYRGNWKKGLADGYGTLVLVDGKKQEGLWRKGKWTKKRDKKVTLVPKKAQITSGCTSGDCRNGKGTYVYPNGSVYIGEFRNGEIYGSGVCYYPDGSKYSGQWKQRYPDGRGTKTYPDGRTRVGLWEKGQAIDSQGFVVDENLLKKENYSNTKTTYGCLKGDCENGSGLKTYPDGSKYEGFFKNAKPHGDGTFYYPNGDKYVGQFKNGYRDGIGTLHHTLGGKKSGKWNEGEFWGQEQNYTETKGCIYGDCENGHGNYIFSDGAKYTGTFRNGAPDGRGTIVYTNKDRYEGFMRAGYMEGQGTFFMADGTKLSGNWKKGTFLGGTPIAPPTHPDQPKLKVWALIIGISSYDHMPVLRYPDDDAYRIFAFLQSPSGGSIPEEQIKILIDESATKSNIKRTMREVFWKAGPNDLVLLYYSGHGLKGAFLPIDFDGSNNKLFHEEIVRILDKSPAKYKLCIADACHSGSLFAARGETDPNSLASYYTSLANAKAGTALIMSSKSNETSLESSGLRQGVFTHFLIRGMKGEGDQNGDKIVNVQELYNYVYREVRKYTRNRQSPTLKGDYDPKMTVGVKQ